MNIREIFGIIWLELISVYHILFGDNYDSTHVRCFNNIGCFDCKPPFYDRLYRPLCYLPQTNLSVRYLLYTRQIPNGLHNMGWTNESISTSPFDGKLPTKMLIPGFNTTLEVDPEFLNIKDELLKQGSYNVIIVDWTNDDNYPYTQAIANGREVGAYTALLLKILKHYKNIDYESVHIIGHSIGAHVAGWIGERLNKIGRITGLDPAGPCFQHAPPAVRLDKSDANFVDIIHTNSGDNFLNGFGLYEAIGDVDFYANGGRRQPACGKMNIFNVLFTRTCSHSLVLKYFKSSINQCRFPSVLCNNYEYFKSGLCKCNNSVIDYMGFHAKKIQPIRNDSLKFYLYTTASSPYCNEPNKCPVSKDVNPKEGFLLYSTDKIVSFILDIIRDLLKAVNLWKEPHHLGTPILTHIQPELLQPLRNALKEHEIKYNIVHEDLQSLIDYEKVTNTPLSISQSEAFDFGIYNQYEEIKFLMAELSTKYPKLVKIERIGKTFENRPIHSVKISAGKSFNKSAIIIECGIHANEWSPVAACAYLVDQLIENYGKNSEITNLLDKYEFNIVLVANPDGYIYTWTKDRMWRKSRSRSTKDFTGLCRGADLNRNFDIHHSGVGSSNDPCQNNYCGDEAFSEGESRALRDLMKSREGRTIAYFAIHSYSQFWMTPYGINDNFPPNYSELERVANIGMEALHKEYNTDYVFGTIFRTIYPASGTSIDYAYTKQGIKYSYALELRDTGVHGHFLPKEQILPMCIETYKGLVAAIKAM